MQRVSKILSQRGVCSRRRAEELIVQGRVLVDGVLHTNLSQKVEENISIQVKGIEVPSQSVVPRLFIYHKPTHCLVTHCDPQARPTIFQNIKKMIPDLPRLVSIGRLDYLSEGLILLTNHPGLARHLEHPSMQWIRRYKVRLFGCLNSYEIDQLEKGITVEGIRYDPIRVTVEEPFRKNNWITLVLNEGKNREIRRLMAYLNKPINRLVRISYGPFQLGKLSKGSLREISGKIIKEQIPYAASLA